MDEDVSSLTVTFSEQETSEIRQTARVLGLDVGSYLRKCLKIGSKIAEFGPLPSEASARPKYFCGALVVKIILGIEEAGELYSARELEQVVGSMERHVRSALDDVTEFSFDYGGYSIHLKLNRRDLRMTRPDDEELSEEIALVRDAGVVSLKALSDVSVRSDGPRATGGRGQKIVKRKASV